MPRIAAGFGAPLRKHLEQVKQRGRRVADRDHRAGQPVAPKLQRRRRARGAELVRERRRARIAQRADHLVARRQPRSRHAMRHHLGIAQDRRARGQAPPRRGREARCRTRCDLRRLRAAAGMDHPHHDLGLVFGKARKIGLGADDCERALVDRVAVADVIVAVHREAPRELTSCATCFGNSSAVTEQRHLAVDEHVATPVAAEHGQRRGGRMGAAFGTTGHMNDLAIGQRPRGAPPSRAPSRAPAISPDAQIGAPAQATTRRRGSAGSTMKPSALGLGEQLSRRPGDTPSNSNARSGAVRSADCAGLTGGGHQARQGFRHPNGRTAGRRRTRCH